MRMWSDSDHEHLPEFRLAQLADRLVDVGALPLDHEELLDCPRCAAMIAEFVRARVEYDHTGYNEEVERWARGVLTPPRRRQEWRRRIPAFWATAAAAMLAAVILWPASQAELSPTQVAQARRESFAFPGLESSWGRDPGPVMRGQGRDSQGQMRATVDSLYQVYGPNPSSAIRPLLVARHLALGEVQDADPLLLWMQQDAPEDPDYLVLRALSLYQRNETQLAVGLLEEVLARSPEDAVAAYDLGKILVAEDDPRGRKLLSELLKKHPNHPLAAAAGRILSSGEAAFVD